MKDYIHNLDNDGWASETILYKLMCTHFIKELINTKVEILEDNTKEIEELDTLNAYKLMESPYMVKLLKEQRYDEFMEHLKQSEVEIANTIMKAEDKIDELVKAVNQIRKGKE